MWHVHLARDSRAGRPCHSIELHHYVLFVPQLLFPGKSVTLRANPPLGSD